MLYVPFSASCPKEADCDELNEDAFYFSLESGRFAISDGASESYDSRTWSRILVSKFVENPHFDSAWLSIAESNYATTSTFEDLSWSKQAAYERGSFATLLGVETNSIHHCVEIFSVGDSLIVLVEDGEFSQSYPFVNSQQFDQRPELLCTQSNQNIFVADSDFHSKHGTTWNITPRSSLLMMTDALGQWVLRSIESQDEQWRSLLTIDSVDQFNAFILMLRQLKKIKIDDTTLLRLAAVGE